MKFNPILHRLSVIAGGLLVVLGIALGAWAAMNLPSRSALSTVDTPVLPRSTSPLAAPVQIASQSVSPVAAPATAAPQRTNADSPVGTPLASPTQNRPEAPTDASELSDTEQDIGQDAEQIESPPLVIGLGADLPQALQLAVAELAANEGAVSITQAGAPTATLSLHWEGTQGVPFYRQVFAAATRFDTLDTTLAWDELTRLWAEPDARFAQVVYLEGTAAGLAARLGAPGDHVVGVPDMEAAIAAAWSVTPTLALVPFDTLHPRLTVLALDGQNPVENAARFDPGAYPLTARVYVQGHTPDAQIHRDHAAYLQQLPRTNRDPQQLTVVAATGVTAMTRNMAAEMESRGYAWPAEEVGPELAAADITLISNEVPFIEDCEPNTSPDNLVFCSKPEYMETLVASGVTIVGLTGNHQNDFGWQGMRDSLEVYAEYGIPVYGGGADRTAATAPLYMEHNGNRLAFLGVNSYGPPSAWATDTAPGSAPYDLAMLSATIRAIKDEDVADLVFAEFQYQESYDVAPLWDQRNDFRAVVRAGADIVTGVQSHVPQGLDFFNPTPLDGGDPAAGTFGGERLILYGLGNLYFDQIWQEPTRDNLIVKHTLYRGRHLSTQVLTTVLHDYGQPRWADPARRQAILERVFGASTFER
ncbi:MAG: CapA family protein [Litorilinea sp.]